MLNGTYRPSRHGPRPKLVDPVWPPRVRANTPPPPEPTKPEGLDELTSEAWELVAPHMRLHGILAGADADVLARYCQLRVEVLLIQREGKRVPASLYGKLGADAKKLRMNEAPIEIGFDE